MSDNKIVKADSIELAVPSWMNQHAGVGQEDVDKAAISKSIIKIVQKTSAEFDEGLAKMGDLMDSITKENYGNEAQFIIVKIDHSWRYFNEQNQLEKQSRDGVNWDDGSKITDEEKWKNKNLDFFVVLVQDGKMDPLPKILSFKGTSFKAGQNLNTQVAQRTCKGEPIFGRLYKIYTEITKNDKGAFAIAKTAMLGFVNEGQCTDASKIRNLVKDIKVDVEAMTQRPEDDNSSIETTATVEEEFELD